MKIKITKKLQRAVLRDLARKGGRARAKRYSKAKLREWGKKGGRPRKRGNR